MNEDTTVKLQRGGRLTVTIEDIAFGGEGVARVHDFVVFVPFVLNGEEVEVELIEVKKQFARARLLSVIKPAPERVPPQCTYYAECGGCQYQHVNYPAQLRLKHKQITDLLQRVGGFNGTAVDPVIPCPSPYGYRNRIMVRSQWNKPEQRLMIGFLRAQDRLVVDVEECKIAEPLLNAELQNVRANPPPRGGLKVVLRLEAEGWSVPKDSFFQNNFHLLPKLVEVVRQRQASRGTRYLLDLYCGVGFFSVELAGQVAEFAGVESDARAVQAARENAASRGLTNGEYLAGRTEELLPSLLRRFPMEETTVMLDPPRTGCPRDIVDVLRASPPSQILYVSCHPATLARDLRRLCAEGTFALRGLTPLDMFPQTQHVEIVADLHRVP